MRVKLLLGENIPTVLAGERDHDSPRKKNNDSRRLKKRCTAGRTAVD
jgi:hypothetical protein